MKCHCRNGMCGPRCEDAWASCTSSGTPSRLQASDSAADDAAEVGTLPVPLGLSAAGMAAGAGGVTGGDAGKPRTMLSWSCVEQNSTVKGPREAELKASTLDTML